RLVEPRGVRCERIPHPTPIIFVISPESYRAECARLSQAQHFVCTHVHLSVCYRDCRLRLYVCACVSPQDTQQTDPFHLFTKVIRQFLPGEPEKGSCFWCHNKPRPLFF